MRNLQSAICNCLGCRMDFTIRPATIDDYTAIDTIFVEVELLHRAALPQIFRAPDGPVLSREYFEAGLADEAFAWLVAERTGALLGFVTVRVVQAPERPILLPRRYAEVNNLAVHAPYRQSGVGRALLKRAEQCAPDQQLGEIEFYEKLGYVTERRTMWRNIRDANS